MSIYKEVAAAALKNWYGKNVSEIDDIFEKQSNREIETDSTHGVWGINSIITGIMSYAESIDASDILALSKKELEDMIFDENDTFVTMLRNATEKKLEKFKTTPEIRMFKQITVVDALEAIHDQWVADNEKKFFKEGRENKQFMHMQIEEIGWKDVTADLVFLQAVLNTSGLQENLADIQNEYEYRGRELFIDMIKNGVKAHAQNYTPLQDSIKKSLDNEAILLHVTELYGDKLGFKAQSRSPLLGVDYEKAMNVRKKFTTRSERATKKMEEVQKQIKEAINNTPEAYLLKIADTRKEGPENEGSSYNCKKNYEIIGKLTSAKWIEVTKDHLPDESFVDGCKYYKSNVAGNSGIIDVSSLPDDVTLYAIDPKGIGYIGLGAANVEKQPVSESYLILGPSNHDENEKLQVWTFHPGAPVRPSEITTEKASKVLGKDIHIGSKLTKEDAIKLGFSMVKYSSPEKVQEYEKISEIMDKVEINGTTAIEKEKIIMDELETLSKLGVKELVMLNGKKMNVVIPDAVSVSDKAIDEILSDR